MFRAMNRYTIMSKTPNLTIPLNGCALLFNTKEYQMLFQHRYHSGYNQTPNKNNNDFNILKKWIEMCEKYGKTYFLYNVLITPTRFAVIFLALCLSFIGAYWCYNENRIYNDAFNGKTIASLVRLSMKDLHISGNKMKEQIMNMQLTIECLNSDISCLNADKSRLVEKDMTMKKEIENINTDIVAQTIKRDNLVAEIEIKTNEYDSMLKKILGFDPKIAIENDSKRIAKLYNDLRYSGFLLEQNKQETHELQKMSVEMNTTIRALKNTKEHLQSEIIELAKIRQFNILATQKQVGVSPKNVENFHNEQNQNLSFEKGFFVLSFGVALLGAIAFSPKS